MSSIWHDFLVIVREEVGSRVVETWFKSIAFVQWDAHAKIMYLRAPNQFIKEWVSAHYMHLFQKHLTRLLGETSLRVIFEDGMSPQTKPESTPLPATESTALRYAPAKPLVTHQPRRTRPTLNHSYNFNNFVVGPSNSLAYAAACAVAEKPGKLYNPFFIYGGSGLGKTHLLHAIGQKIKENHPQICVLYQTADYFVKEFINAIRFDKVYAFEKKYKDVDVLLIDDIQFISHKEQTQEAFFHIFNELHQAQKQIVFTSDSLPRNIEGLAERMRSRLEWGLITDISVPHLETKVAILKKKAEIIREELPDEVAHAIASRISSNIRELEGMLMRTIACASLTGEALNITLINKLFPQTATPAAAPKSCGLADIADLVSKMFDISLSEMRATNRSHEVVIARHAALYLMRKMTDASLREIGSFLQRKDHTTVMHACQKMEEAIAQDPVIAQRMRALEKDLTTG